MLLPLFLHLALIPQEVLDGTMCLRQLDSFLFDSCIRLMTL